MELNREEEKILKGSEGKAAQKAMEILLAIGGIYGAERLIPVSSVQISGVSYKTIGDAGLEFLEDFAKSGAKVKCRATLNPLGIELGRDKAKIKFKAPENFVKKQTKILNAYLKMDAIPTCTCTPYLAGHEPKFGEHIAWAESSAVVYANSAIGARTNRESGISALASAITGKTPLYGLHFRENRAPKIAVKVESELKDAADYSALGYYISKNFNQIPLFTGIKPNKDELKAMSASLGIGSINMFHVENITPESNDFGTKNLEKISIGKKEIKSAYEELNTCKDAEIICIGCPHASLEEIKAAREIAARNPKKEILAYTSKKVKSLIKNKKIALPKNVKIIADTCMVVSPLKEMGINSLATNSAKCAFYSRNLSKINVKFGSLRKLI